VWPVKKADVCLTGNHLPKYIFLLVIAYWFVCMFMKPIPRPKFSVTSEGSSSTREGVNLPPQLSRKSNTKNKLIVKLMLTWLTVVIRMLERGKPGTQWRQSRQSQKKPASFVADLSPVRSTLSTVSRSTLSPKLNMINSVAAPEISSCRGTTGALQSLTGHSS